MGLYKPIVIFFGMKNSLATFQGMMKEILRDLINEGKVVAFVDDILVETDSEEGHDEIVEGGSAYPMSHFHQKFTGSITTIRSITVA